MKIMNDIIKKNKTFPFSEYKTKFNPSSKLGSF